MCVLDWEPQDPVTRISSDILDSLMDLQYKFKKITIQKSLVQIPFTSCVFYSNIHLGLSSFRIESSTLKQSVIM